jgi:tetratricopeptide (TPR) repeat protein
LDHSYRDPNNAVFWCSIGVLYYMMVQYRDALHAYIRAIRLNPNLAEGWFDLGLLYETCDQPTDALDAYHKASELENNPITLERLNHVKLLVQRGGQANGGGAVPNVQPILPDPTVPSRPRPGNVPDFVLPNPGSLADITTLPFTTSNTRPAAHTPTARPQQHFQN